MSQAKLSRITGIRAAKISDLYNDVTLHLSLENIDLLCEALSCSVGDLLEYVPNQHRKTGESLIVEEHGNRKDRK